jgi:hypothetical protein
MVFIGVGVLALFAFISMEMDKRTKASDELMEQAKKRMEENNQDTSTKTIDTSMHPASYSHIKI